MFDFVKLLEVFFWSNEDGSESQVPTNLYATNSQSRERLKVPAFHFIGESALNLCCHTLKASRGGAGKGLL